MRADRLVSLLLLLQTRGRVTAAQAAAELEVSVPTVRRDLEALSAAGVPVYPQPGRGGGWSLVGGARTDLSGLTAPEVHALFLLLGPGADVSPAVRTALRKLVRALPAPFRADAEAAGSAVVVDHRRWGSAVRSAPAHLDALRTAVVGRRRVRLAYADHAGRSSDRKVEPLGLVDRDGVWYLLAGTARGDRTFRLDRVSGVEVLDATFVVPPGFDLATAWEAVAARVEEARSAVAATVTLPDDLVERFRAHVGETYVQVVGPVAGRPGRTRLRVRADTATMLARQVAGWADLVAVEEPEAVRSELARLGSALAAYAR